MDLCRNEIRRVAALVIERLYRVLLERIVLEAVRSERGSVGVVEEVVLLRVSGAILL